MGLTILGIEQDNALDFGLLKREVRRIVKLVLRAAAREWHHTMLPRHFTPNNTSRYGYERRHPLYRDIKRKTRRGQARFVDLLASGRSKRAALFRQPRITATSRRAQAILNMPAYFVKPYIGPVRDAEGRVNHVIRDQPDKPEELTAVSRRERDVLARHSADRFARLVEKARTRKRTKF